MRVEHECISKVAQAYEVQARGQHLRRVTVLIDQRWNHENNDIVVLG